MNKKKHIWIGNGSRRHVEYWDSNGMHCKEEGCELEDNVPKALGGE